MARQAQLVRYFVDKRRAFAIIFKTYSHASDFNVWRRSRKPRYKRLSKQRRSRCLRNWDMAPHSIPQIARAAGISTANVYV